MKVYIGNRQLKDESFKVINDPEMLQYIAEDSECNVIVLDNTLSKINLDEVNNIINLCIKKLRIKGKFVINDIDFELLNYIYSRNPDLKELNAMLQAVGGFKSLLSYELIKEILDNYKNMMLSGISLNNMEFKLEYSRES
jgi:predicted SAM-dependent methyltransferase